jgi:hypothetical protein
MIEGEEDRSQEEVSAQPGERTEPAGQPTLWATSQSTSVVTAS